MSNKKRWAKRIKFKGKLKKHKVFRSSWVRKFLNKITKNGKMGKAELIFYNVISKMKTNERLNFMPFFFKIIKKIKIIVTTQLRRLGKYFHHIPTYIKFPSNYSHGMLKFKEIVGSRGHSHTPFGDRIYSEFWTLFFDYKNSATSKLKKKRILLICKNSTYTHFRWK